MFLPARTIEGQTIFSVRPSTALAANLSRNMQLSDAPFFVTELTYVRIFELIFAQSAKSALCALANRISPRGKRPHFHF